MKKLLSAILIGISICACTSPKTKPESKADTTMRMKQYNNEYFSLQYPSHWECEEEINNMKDSIPVMSEGIRATFYNPNPYSPHLTVMVQKSAMTPMIQSLKTPEEWRDLSVEFKHFDKQYLGTVDDCMLDSLRFGPYPAAMAGFVVVLENGDTLVHKQTVVIVDNDLYYLNNTFDFHDKGYLEQLGDSILSTVKFNKAGK